MTNITPPSNLFINTGAQYKIQVSDRLAATVKTAVSAAKIAEKPYTTEPVQPVPAEPLSRRDQRGIKLASIPKSLIDSRSALTIKQGSAIPHTVISEDVTTKHIQPIKVPPVISTPIDDGGFTVSIGPDGTAICGTGPSGPVRWPPIPEPEEM